MAKTIIVADGGSSKTDWRLLMAGGKVAQTRTEGFNPYFQTSEQIAALLQPLRQQWPDAAPAAVHFYGAGCATEEKKAVVHQALTDCFPGAYVSVASDMLAAARALCGRAPGVACILGTGANSCRYDGAQIVRQLPNLGFWLGDEGSGGYLGKRLVEDYLRGDMPKRMAEAFARRYRLQPDTLLADLYRAERPNAFAAQFAKFLFDQRREPYAARLTYDAFAAFFERYVTRLLDGEALPVHFVGSVAFYFGDMLRRVAADQGVPLQRILEGPIAGLALYHQPATET